MVKQRHQLFVALLCCLDATVVAAATAIAWAVRRSFIERFAVASWETYFKEPLFAYTIPATILALWGFGLYRPRRDRSLVSEQIQIIKASLAAIAITVVALYIARNSIIWRADYGPTNLLGLSLDAGRLQLGTLALTLPVLLGLHRAVFRTTLRAIRRRGWNLRHVAVIGVGRLGQIAARTLDRNSWTGINVAYFISHHDQTRRTQCLGRPVRGGLDGLETILEREKIDAVYIAIPNSRAAVLPSVLSRLDRFAIDVRVIPDVTPRYMTQSMAVNELDGMPILSYRENPHYGLGGLTKRGLDLAGGALAILLFSPIMALCAAAVAFTSPGPVIFRQRRVSLGGEEFNIYKFRTMYYAEDEQGHSAAWTQRGDPRVTPIGRWLRRTSLDELPQLFNVIRGDMSLVGPRPERPELIMQFREDWRGYMLRQHVKAGMTGWAQVNGHRGQTSLRKRLQYDLFYIRHWSLAFDLRILWLTLFRGFVHRNAH